MGWFGNKDKGNDAAGDIKAKERVKAHQVVCHDIISKKSLAVLTVRVVVVMDVSSSMQSDLRSGLVQDITERCLPMGLEFDDDGEIEFYIFSNDCKQVSSCGIDNIGGFVDNKVVPKIRWGGTEYAPAVQMIVQDYGIKKPSKDPTFVLFITDGDNSDKQRATEAIKKAAEYNIFFKFIGVGSASMPYLEHLDDMLGRVVDNANFFQVRDIKKMKDEELYEKLLEEYGDWTAAARMAGILQ